MDGITSNVASLSMAMSAQSLQNSVDLYTVRKAMDLQSMEVAQLLNGFEQANAGVSAPPVDGVGVSLDVMA